MTLPGKKQKNYKKVASNSTHEKHDIQMTWAVAVGLTVLIVAILHISPAPKITLNTQANSNTTENRIELLPYISNQKQKEILIIEAIPTASAPRKMASSNEKNKFFINENKEKK